jgi:hypothetical protein
VAVSLSVAYDRAVTDSVSSLCVAQSLVLRSATDDIRRDAPPTGEIIALIRADLFVEIVTHTVDEISVHRPGRSPDGRERPPTRVRVGPGLVGSGWRGAWPRTARVCVSGSHSMLSRKARRLRFENE